MPSFLKPSPMTLIERLRLHTNNDVQLEAEDFSSEPGMLRKVGKRFIRVDDQYFLPASLQEIVLLGAAPKGSGAEVVVRSRYRGSIRGELVRTGADFMELKVPTTGEEELDWLLIPLQQIVSIEKV